MFLNAVELGMWKVVTSTSHISGETFNRNVPELYFSTFTKASDTMKISSIYIYEEILHYV